MLAPSLWTAWFTMGPASERRCKNNFSIPIPPTLYNPLDREFWTLIYNLLYDHMCYHSALMKLWESSKAISQRLRNEFLQWEPSFPLTLHLPLGGKASAVLYLTQSHHMWYRIWENHISPTWKSWNKKKPRNTMSDWQRLNFQNASKGLQVTSWLQVLGVIVQGLTQIFQQRSLHVPTVFAIDIMHLHEVHRDLNNAQRCTSRNSNLSRIFRFSVSQSCDHCFLIESEKKGLKIGRFSGRNQVNHILSLLFRAPKKMVALSLVKLGAFTKRALDATCELNREKVTSIAALKWTSLDEPPEIYV